MKTQAKILFPIVVMSSLSLAESAFASISINTELTLGSGHIYGNCRLIITPEEPYSHFNSNCHLDRNDITIDGHDLPGYEIGYPRSSLLSTGTF